MIATFTLTMHLKSDPAEFEIRRYVESLIKRCDELFDGQIKRVIIGPIKKVAEKEIIADKA
jgi:hypothetical protein